MKKRRFLAFMFAFIFVLILINFVYAEISILRYEPIVYLSKNIEKKVFIDVLNTGDSDLYEVSLNLLNLDEDFYAVKPGIINLIKSGETKTFELDFLVKDFTGEQDFSYAINSGIDSINKSGMLVVLTVSEYFRMEVKDIENKINSTRSSVGDGNLAEEFKKCEDLFNKSKTNLKNEEFIDLKDNLNKTNECIDNLNNKLVEKPLTSSQPKSQSNIDSKSNFRFPTIQLPKISISIPDINYWKFIGWVFLFIVILFFIYVIYGLYRKFGVVDFFEKESKNIHQKKMGEDSFYEKIRDIEERLND